MRDSERKVGRADHNLAGARSVAEGETQEPEKVVDEDAVDRSERTDPGVVGSESASGSPADKQRMKGESRGKQGETSE